MKKIIALVMTLALLISAIVIIPSASVADLITMYTYFENGNTVNVRSEPDKNAPVIARLGYGVPIEVEFINSTGWAVIFYNGQEAYIQARFVVESKPKARAKDTQKEKEAAEREQEQKKLNNELKSEKEIAEPYYIAVRANRTTGWINFRVGPSKITSRVSSFPEGKELIAIGETTNWYRARDPETQKIGYIHKNYTTDLNRKVAAETPSGDQSLGSLNINGEFELTCKLPEGYKVQVVNKRGASIVASIQSDDMTKPQLYLSIGYDDTYGDVERLNDLTDEQLAVLEASFTDMNEVDISYRMTGYGTKLLVARETGADTDFVDILTIYKGYFIEFNMTPNLKAADQTLTDDQVRMCVDFLTDVNFVPAK